MLCGFCEWISGTRTGGSRIFSRLSLWRVSAWHHLHEVGLAVRHCSRRNCVDDVLSVVQIHFAFRLCRLAAVMAVMAIHHSGRRKKQVNSARMINESSGLGRFYWPVPAGDL